MKMKTAATPLMLCSLLALLLSPSALAAPGENNGNGNGAEFLQAEFIVKLRNAEANPQTFGQLQAATSLQLLPLHTYNRVLSGFAVR